MPTSHIQDFGRSVVAAAAFAANINFGRSSGYFDLSAEEKPLLHTWSLGVEEQFYLLAPLLILWSCRRGQGWIRIAVLTALAASFALSLALAASRPAANFYLLPTRAWKLLSGAAVALLPTPSVERLPVRWSEGLGLCGLALVLSAVALTEPFTAVSP